MLQFDTSACCGSCWVPGRAVLLEGTGSCWHWHCQQLCQVAQGCPTGPAGCHGYSTGTGPVPAWDAVGVLLDPNGCRQLDTSAWKRRGKKKRGKSSFTVYTILITKIFCTLHFLFHYLHPPPIRNWLFNYNFYTVHWGLSISSCWAGRIVHSLMFHEGEKQNRVLFLFWLQGLFEQMSGWRLAGGGLCVHHRCPSCVVFCP